MKGRLGLFAVVVAVALVYLWAQAWLKEYGDGVYPSSLGRYHVLDEGINQWKVFTMQATVVGYREIDGRQYLVVLYEEEDKWRTALIFVTGEIAGQRSERLAYVGEEGKVEVLDYAGIKDKAKRGKRVRIEYLQSYPENWREADPVFCERFYPACLYPALMAREELKARVKPTRTTKPKAETTPSTKKTSTRTAKRTVKTPAKKKQG